MKPAPVIYIDDVCCMLDAAALELAKETNTRPLKRFVDPESGRPLRSHRRRMIQVIRRAEGRTKEQLLFGGNLGGGRGTGSKCFTTTTALRKVGLMSDDTTIEKLVAKSTEELDDGLCLLAERQEALKNEVFKLIDEVSRIKRRIGIQ